MTGIAQYSQFLYVQGGDVLTHVMSINLYRKQASLIITDIAGPQRPRYNENATAQFDAR